MTTERQLLQIPFAGGQDDKTSSLYLSNGKQKTIRNAVFNKLGTVESRYGFKPLSKSVTDGTTLAAAAKLLAYKNELLLIDGVKAYSYSPNANKWATRDHVSTCVGTRQSIAQSAQSFGDGDIGDGNGFRVIAWFSPVTSIAAGDIYASVFDTTTGSAVLSNVLLSGSLGSICSHPKVVVTGTWALVFYDNGPTNQAIYVRVLDLTNPSAGFGAAQAVAMDRVVGSLASDAWDVCPVVGSVADFMLVYNSTHAVNAINVSRWTAAAAPTQQVVIYTSETITNIAPIAVRATSGGSVWIAYGALNGVDAYIKSCRYATATLGTLNGPWTVGSYAAFGAQYAYWIGVEEIDSGHAAVIWQGGSGIGASVSWVRINTSPAVDISARTTQAVSMLSRPFMAKGRLYMLGLIGYAGVAAAPTANATTVLVDLHIDDTSALMQMREVARIAPRFAGPANRLPNSLTSVNAPGGAGTQFVLMSTIGANVAGYGRAGVAACTFDFAHTGRWQAVELGQSLYMSGGVPSIYDSTLVSEIGFAYFPVVAAPSIGAGGAIADGTYQYTFVYEWINARGERQQSAPAAPKTVIIAGGGGVASVTFTVPTLYLTAKQEADASGTQVAIVPYKTTAGGTIFYRAISDNVPSGLLNTVYASTISWTDLGGGSVTSNALLYTTGGVLENDCPSSFSAIAAHKGRIWGVGDDGTTLWYSTQNVPGQVVRFNDTAQITMPEVITALFSLDDSLVAFSAKSIYFILGDGPPETGAGSDFIVTPKLPNDVGCIDVRSAALTPSGIVFLASFGLYLLDRSHQVQWIGKAVVDTLATYSTITSCVVVPEWNHVRWTCQNASSGLSVIVVWDYNVNEWSTWDVYDSTTFTSYVGLTSGVYSQGDHIITTAAGQVMQERSPGDAAQYLDGLPSSGTDVNGWIHLVVETGEIHLAGLQGYKRARLVQLLCEGFSAHGVRLTATADFGSVSSQAWTSAAVGAMFPEAMQLRLSNPRCQTLRVRVEILPPSGTVGTGQGARLDGLLVEWMPKSGPARLPAAQKG